MVLTSADLSFPFTGLFLYTADIAIRLCQSGNVTTVTEWRVLGKGNNRAIVFTLPVDKVSPLPAWHACPASVKATLLQKPLQQSNCQLGTLYTAAHSHMLRRIHAVTDSLCATCCVSCTAVLSCVILCSVWVWMP